MWTAAGVVVAAGWLVTLAGTAMAHADETLARLAEQADAIALMEIRATDTRAMPADGPMKVEAKVVKGVKGRLAEGALARFDASAWMGPTYQPGERRIVFLERVDAEGAAEWASSDAGWVDLFFTDEEMAGCSEETLWEFLQSLGRQPPRPRLQFRAGPPQSDDQLEVPENDRRCQQDADCVLISTHCGGCSCGTAVDRRWQSHYEEAFRSICEGLLGPICDMHCPPQIPRCVAFRCARGS